MKALLHPKLQTATSPIPNITPLDAMPSLPPPPPSSPAPCSVIGHAFHDYTTQHEKFNQIIAAVTASDGQEKSFGKLTIMHKVCCGEKLLHWGFCGLALGILQPAGCVVTG